MRRSVQFIPLALAAICVPIFTVACSSESSAENDSAKAAVLSTAAPTTSQRALTLKERYDEALRLNRIQTQYPTYSGDQELCSALQAGGRPENGTIPAKNSAQLLAEGYYFDKAAPTQAEQHTIRRIEVMIPVLCPDQVDTVAKAKAGDYEVLPQTKFGDGKYLVGEKLQPGTYTIPTKVTDCYWERSDAQGNIIDNNFISIAPSVTVTVGASDSGFTSNGCGTWELAS